MPSRLRVGTVAASSAVPMVELSLGVEKLQAAGFDVRVHPLVGGRSFTFAGSDQDRLEALWDYAADPLIDVIWAARGGYGATRLLPMLEDRTASHGPPRRKLLMGYSDVTALHEFVRSRWGWATLHANMPAASSFLTMTPQEWESTCTLVRNRSSKPHWNDSRLEFIGPPPKGDIQGELIGGNLSVWSCLAGTRWQPSAAGKILFFEDVGEAWYRIDRMITHVRQAGMLEGAKALLLGDFTNCKDERQTMARSREAMDEKVPLRRYYEPREAMAEIFGALGMPVAIGLPVGHGPRFAPLPLGAAYRLTPDGTLRMLSWDWDGEK